MEKGKKGKEQKQERKQKRKKRKKRKTPNQAKPRVWVPPRCAPRPAHLLQAPPPVPAPRADWLPAAPAGTWAGGAGAAGSSPAVSARCRRPHGAAQRPVRAHRGGQGPARQGHVSAPGPEGGGSGKGLGCPRAAAVLLRPRDGFGVRPAASPRDLGERSRGLGAPPVVWGIARNGFRTAPAVPVLWGSPPGWLWGAPSFRVSPRVALVRRPQQCLCLRDPLWGGLWGARSHSRCFGAPLAFGTPQGCL